MQRQRRTACQNEFSSSDGEEVHNSSKRARYDEDIFGEDDEFFKSTNDNPTTFDNLRTIGRSCSFMEDHEEGMYQNL